MFLPDFLEKALVLVFLVAAVASVGMQVTTADLRAHVARRGLRWRTLPGNVVVVPAIGIPLSRFVSDPGTAGAFVLLACTPGGISALQFTTKSRGAALLVLALTTVGVPARQQPTDFATLRQTAESRPGAADRRTGTPGVQHGALGVRQDPGPAQPGQDALRGCPGVSGRRQIVSSDSIETSVGI